MQQTAQVEKTQTGNITLSFAQNISVKFELACLCVFSNNQQFLFIGSAERAFAHGCQVGKIKQNTGWKM